MRKYDDEFKREAVRKIHNGQSVASVARELGCAESLLHRSDRAEALNVAGLFNTKEFGVAAAIGVSSSPNK